MGFSEILKDLRKEKHITQRELASYLGLTANSICEWENKRSEPSMLSITKMCSLFEVSADYLLGRTDDFGNIAVAPFEPSLSAEEQKLIKNFRAMRSDLQAYYLEMSETFIQKPENLIQQEKTKGEKRYGKQ